jgi:hypothetical protein
MKKQIELKVPTSYGDISLHKWLGLQKEIKNYEGDDEAVGALMLYHLCGLDPIYLKGLAAKDYNILKNELASFIQDVELELQRFVTIDGVEYGFEPNLSKMAYGAYADISKFGTIGIDENWAKIMNILYRPVSKKIGDMYSIQPYTGDDKYEKWLNVPMDIHFGALFFLLNLQTNLLNSILKSSMEMEVPHNIKPILARSGAHMQQLLNWQKAIYSDSTKLLKNR